MEQACTETVTSLRAELSAGDAHAQSTWEPLGGVRVGWSETIMLESCMMHRAHAARIGEGRLETMFEALHDVQSTCRWARVGLNKATHDAQSTRRWAEQKLRCALSTSGSPNFRTCLLKLPT